MIIIRETMFREFRFKFTDVCPDDKSLAAALQIHDEGAYNDLLPVINSVLERLKDHCGIIGGYSISHCEEIDIEKGIISCGGRVLESGRRVTSYMKNASHLAAFVCTAGEIFSELSDEYFEKGDFPEAFIVDSIGSVTVENAMDKIQLLLEKEMNSAGMKISNRYSPGYCEWPVIGQQVLFSLIGDNSTGVTLTESCLMQPIKSVSGIIGIGKNIKKYPYGCSICNSKSCVYRKIKK